MALGGQIRASERGIGTHASEEHLDCESRITHSTLAFRFFLLTLAAAWFLTTTVAFAAVRNRNVQIHREWMVRSYAITTTFVTTRVLTAIPAIGAGGEAVSVPAQWSGFGCFGNARPRQCLSAGVSQRV
jgi:hypothetical protein